ncbi:MAG: GTPase ObgE [Armatimonadetes bacterium]|nr:GTPase ObgE [Armatimonadota bacterium]
MLVDEAVISVRSGRGGNGIVSFRREKFVPKGGPAGGDGGKGGDVLLYTDDQLSTLIDFRYAPRYAAEDGWPGQSSHKTGRHGADCLIRVPVGTLVYDHETGELLADLGGPRMKLLVARGGRGGRGNVHFATPSRQAPEVAEGGEPAQQRRLRLELRLLADVGVIGFPNVGKSTLISVVSAARPKVADYPFTTLAPNLGVVSLPGVGRSFVLADMPGLIVGAHEGAGLGDRFLKHISRTRLLIHVLDAAALEGRDPVEDFDAINRELALFGEGLADIPQIVALNKVDLPDGREFGAIAAEALQARGLECHLISAATREGVDRLMEAAWAKLAQLPAAEAQAGEGEEELLIAAPPREEPLTIEVTESGAFRVCGTAAERAVARAYMQSREGLAAFHEALRRAGVLDALKQAGAVEGDTVRLGKTEFDYLEDDREPIAPRRRTAKERKQARRDRTP